MCCSYLEEKKETQTPLKCEAAAELESILLAYVDKLLPMTMMAEVLALSLKLAATGERVGIRMISPRSNRASLKLTHIQPALNSRCKRCFHFLSKV